MADEQKNYIEVKYSQEEKAYKERVLKRIETALMERDAPHDEFDGQTYLKYCESNRKGALTYIEPKKNKEDTNYSSGTIRQKIFTYLSALNNLDLAPDVNAFDSHNNLVRDLGEAMEDILYQIGENDGEGGDDEKKLMRQYTMLEQGTVFVREQWKETYGMKKDVSKKFDGTIESASWTSSVVKSAAKCVREIVANENVIPGSIRVFGMEKQPHFTTVDIVPRSVAEAEFGKWERWKYVPENVTDTLNTQNQMFLYAPFHIFGTTQNQQVEIIRYEDKWNNEYQIFVNGVMMLPVGYPLTEISPSGEYSVAAQVLEPISADFFFGKSMPAKMKNDVFLLDEMTRMAVLKTQKSYAPPLINNTGKVLSPRIFAPGKQTYGIDGTKLTKLDPDSSNGVTNSEFAMLKYIQESINRNSVDPVVSGQQPTGGNVTATQILETQRQAKMMIGLTVFTAALLERKLSWLRIFDVLQYWFTENDVIPNGYTGDFVKEYRSINIPKRFEGVGMGRQIIRLADNIPMDQAIIDEQNALSTEQGQPVRVKYLNVPEIKKAKLMWYVVVTPREKKSSAFNKVLFGEMSQWAMQFQDVNLQYLEERGAAIYEEDPNKLFNRQQQSQMGAQPPMGQDKGSDGPTMPGANPSNRPGIPVTGSLLNSAKNSVVNSAQQNA